MNTVVPVLPPGDPRAQSPAAEPPPAAAHDSGLACLVMLAQFHAVAADPEKLRHEFSRDGQALDAVDILNAAKSLGLVAARRRPSRARLALAALPAIALAKDGGFFILARVDQDKALIQEPGASGPQVLELAALDERWSGELIQITSRASLAGELAKFDFSWFIPAVVKYRRALLEVLLVSFVLQFFMLVTPLFFQVVSVLSNASSGTISDPTTSITIQDNDQPVWSVASAGTVDEGAGFLTYTVTRTGATNTAATIQFATAGGTASAGGDYTAVNQILSFAIGETSKTVMVAINDDASAEGNETVVAGISNASAGSINTATASATVQDNDQSVWAVGGSDAGEGAGFLTYTVTRTGATNTAATIQFATVGGTATAGSDYTAVNQTLSFAAGESSKTVTVAINDDSTVESAESLTVAISNASSGTVGSAASDSATILDNDQSTWVVGGPGTVDEGAGLLSYTVSRTGAAAAATIQFATTSGSATAGSDYTGLLQTLSFATGEMSKTVTVALADDAIAESNESVGVAISNASSGTIATVTASATIQDNDQSAWSVSGIDAGEGAGFLTYTVARTGAANTAATIQFATVGGTAAAGSDYTAVSQTLSFAAGEVRKTIMVAITDDANAESNEDVVAAISNASTGNIGTATVSADIQDNDQAIWVVGAASTDETSGFATFGISRSGALGAATIVFDTGAATVTSAALPGSDYTPVHLTLSFAAGEVRKSVMVPVLDDATPEISKSLIGVISNASTGTIGTTSVSAVLGLNDATRTNFSVSAASGTVGEDNAQAVYTITRSGDVSSAQTIDYTIGGTANVDEDYVNPGTVTVSFAAGETTKQVGVRLLADTTAGELTETVVLTLQNASGGAITTKSATVNLTDNDTALSYAYTISNTAAASVYENTGKAVFVVSRTGDLSATSVSYFQTTDTGTAKATDGDFSALIQTLSWAAGESTKTVLVDLLDDAAAESSETLIVQSATDSGFSTGTATATTTLLDNDSVAATSYAFNVATGSSYESAGALAFGITRSGDVSVASTSYFRTNGGTATAGGDYTATNQTLSWAAGESVKLVTVTLVGDADAEGNETVITEISTVSDFSSGVLSATRTVLDDDMYTATAGVADTLTTGTVNGSYLGGTMLSTGDQNDIVTIGTASNANSVVDLGAGDDTLNTGSAANFLVNGAQYIGGAGVDTLALGTSTAAYNFSTTASAGNLVKGFEIISMAASGNQTLNLSLQDVLEFTSGNAVDYTLRITGNTGDILNLQALGKTILDPGASINDVDGTSYTVAATNVGNSSAKDVDFGGVTYDVFRYDHGGHTLNLLVNVQMTTNVI